MRRMIFQSTLPARGATKRPPGDRPGAGFQSTLPARGATRQASPLTIQITNFNPRSPQGERRPRWCRRTGGPDFNPRSPQGERRPGGTPDASPDVFQSTLPARGATAKVHKNSCSNSHYCLKLSFFLPSPTSCCTPKPKVSTEDPSSIWCEPPGIFLSACGSRFLKESEALPADRRPCSQNAQSCFHSDCPGNKTAGCPSPGP